MRAGGDDGDQPQPTRDGGATPVVRTDALSKRYGSTVALQDLTIEVPAGVVFGFLGPNGAGKTTTIRILMGLLSASGGSARVLGLDARRDRDAIHRRVGYLPDAFAADLHLTGEQYLRYLSGLRGSVEWQHVDLLAKRLDLDLGARIGALSHGNRQKIGLVQAFMHRPDLLVLDEPTMGLDPLVQREFISLVREVRAEGRTVFLSSHILDQVEACADMVAILRRGRLVVIESVEALKRRARWRLRIEFASPPPVALLRKAAGVVEAAVEGKAADLVVEGSMDELMRAATPLGIRSLVSREADLEEIFLAYYGGEGP